MTACVTVIQKAKTNVRKLVDKLKNKGLLGKADETTVIE